MHTTDYITICLLFITICLLLVFIIILFRAGYYTLSLKIHVANTLGLHGMDYWWFLLH